MFIPGRSISLPSRRRPCNGLSLSLAAVRFPRDSLVFFPPAHTAIRHGNQWLAHADIPIRSCWLGYLLVILLIDQELRRR
jgi:hypothetical protein